VTELEEKEPPFTSASTAVFEEYTTGSMLMDPDAAYDGSVAISITASAPKIIVSEIITLKILFVFPVEILLVLL
jgi:hypothetical protein